jgi:kumamolisin
VQQAFSVSLKRVIVEGEEFVAADTAPSVPQPLAGVVASINGLQPYRHFNKLATVRPSQPAADREAVTPEATISGKYFPAGIMRAYKALPFLAEDGAGTRTAILIDTFPNANDLLSFWSLTGTAQSLSNIVFVQAVAGTLSAPSGEETLDTEWASGIGYGSEIRVYATKTLAFTSLDTGFQRMLSDIKGGVAINQLSVSLGLCEPFVPAGEITTEENLLAMIAAREVSIFVSSGDAGAQECGPGKGLHASFPATSPVVTAVGGTHLVVTGTLHSPTLSIKTETAWSGSGGGISQFFAVPEYQRGLGLSDRGVPDVAADADPATGVEIVLNGNEGEVGGTSASTPMWAGFAAMINQGRFAAGKSALGQLNPRIYRLLSTANFRDITRGCNGGFCASPGYDLTTGIGSPVMNKLLPALVAQP